MNVRIAYIISAYRYPHLLVRLVRRLHTPHTSFVIHVDKKSAETVHRCIKEGLVGMPAVHFLDSHVCYWGGFGHVRATLKAIEHIVVRKIPCDFAVLLTGQDYPVKSNADIGAFFATNQSVGFINYYPLPKEDWELGGVERVRSWHFRPFGWHIRIPGKRSVPNGLQPYGGSSYWCLPRCCVAYIYKFIKQHPGFVRFFEHVDVPDELFFQTILLNSPEREHIVNDNLRYIQWKDESAAGPSVLTTADFEELVHSSKLFARKFDATVDEEILDMIDKQILARSMHEPSK